MHVDDKTHAFKRLTEATDCSGLPFEKRRELVDRWIAELETAVDEKAIDLAEIARKERADFLAKYPPGTVCRP